MATFNDKQILMSKKSFFSISKGWLRVNVVLSIIIIATYILIPIITGKGNIKIFRVILLVVLPYWLLFYLIKWVKEGFNK